MAEARLGQPSDSHEPQRAHVILHGDGPGGAGPVAFICRFLDGAGAVLEQVAGSVPALSGRAEGSVTYYGWPRASRVACRVGAP
ncbi:hypothetical protein [Methylobacterium symbioticum]|uniref:Uncharacterized protein n=1 Tax=Methylobacterium symbioticum TaxID=2584084 RepID=A0A509E925_9HYPH|nr:hypothetical protein [Methylobacterium symbioticum]VUD70608.1 hypothetical protein MET9862_01178 [Methylobacterium symbioticum]